jgi:hypothetical protein
MTAHETSESTKRRLIVAFPSIVMCPSAKISADWCPSTCGRLGAADVAGVYRL